MRFVLPYGNYRDHSVLSFVIFYALYFFSVKKQKSEFVGFGISGLQSFAKVKFDLRVKLMGP